MFSSAFWAALLRGVSLSARVGYMQSIKVVRIALEELLSWMLYFKVKSTLFIFTYTQDPIIYHIEEKYIIEYTKNKRKR